MIEHLKELCGWAQKDVEERLLKSKYVLDKIDL